MLAYDIRPKHYPINVYFIQKVSLARALYRSSELSLLDDPLCSLDQTVQRLVFEKALGRESILAGKTRLLVTQNKELIQKCDWVVQMDRKWPIFYCFKLAVNCNVNVIKKIVHTKFIYLFSIPSDALREHSALARTYIGVCLFHQWCWIWIISTVWY